jgi:hypothetical protein
MKETRCRAVVALSDVVVVVVVVVFVVVVAAVVVVAYDAASTQWRQLPHCPEGMHVQYFHLQLSHRTSLPELYCLPDVHARVSFIIPRASWRAVACLWGSISSLMTICDAAHMQKQTHTGDS